MYDAKTDMWSLGVLLYELMALKLPFKAQDMQGLVVKIVRSEPVPLPNIYTRNLRRVALRLLCKDPKGRLSAKEILELEWLKPVVDELRSATT